jgi:hypothetical protein
MLITWWDFARHFKKLKCLLETFTRTSTSFLKMQEWMYRFPKCLTLFYNYFLIIPDGYIMWIFDKYHEKEKKSTKVCWWCFHHAKTPLHWLRHYLTHNTWPNIPQKCGTKWILCTICCFGTHSPNQQQITIP